MHDTMLIIEDESLLGAELTRHFRREGWEVVHARDLASARKTLLEGAFDPLVVLADMTLPDGNALDLLESVQGAGPGEWLFLTGYGTVADSVRALRLGAFDFLEKPCPMERIDLVVAGAARSARAHRRLREQSAHHEDRYGPEAFLGRSAAAEAVRGMLRKLAAVPLSAVVVAGETGTGKGLAARILHHNGQRSAGPLVELNCATLPRDLLESELFGHERGAFTGAAQRRRGLVQQASGGTLFLDEIAELELDLQAKLLRVIEDRVVRPLGSDRETPVDVQVIAASNRNLQERVRAGAFRQDLFHRLSVFQLTLPPLRARLDDLEDLVPAFMAEYSAVAGKSVQMVPDRVWHLLRRHRWPGNVRELRNVIERCVLFSSTGELEEQWLGLADPASPSGCPDGTERPDVLCLPVDGSMSLDAMDRAVVAKALELAEHNVSAAARLLRTTRQTLRYRIHKHGLDAEEGHDEPPE